MKKQKSHLRLSTTGRQKQRLNMRYAAAASMFIIIASAGIIYLNFQHPEKSVAATTNHINTINYRSTDVAISERYLRPAEQITSEGRNRKDEGTLNGKISMPSRGQDVVIREIQIPINN